MAEFLAVFAFDVDGQLEQCASCHTNEKVYRVEAGERIGKCCAEIGKAAGELVNKLRTGSQPEDRRQLIHKVEGEHIREIEKDELFDVEFFLHSSTPRSFVLTFSLCWALDCSLLRESFCLRDCFSFCLTVLAENSLNA